MKILFLAKHGSGDNDDEGAIAHALTALGHDVVCVHEMRRHRTVELSTVNADLCLFLKTPVVSEVAETAKRMPCVFWFFDLVTSNDPTLMARSRTRVQWMIDILPYVLVGFCTDGDWVENTGHRGKLVWLMQGMDERVAGFGVRKPEPYPPILFAGMVNHGQSRAQHIAELQARYGDKFGILGGGGPRGRIHGRALADVFASTKIVIAPDGPQSDRYWSNRIYNTLGLGGFLLHPYTKGLYDQYEHYLVMYETRDHLHWLIQQYLKEDEQREKMRLFGFNHTMAANTYRHRCEELIRVVKERM